ncbi:Polygalacturonase inhibitor 1 [Cardamine amara subsp. amara]|uniref:Polygalacturonase inhibitor 1 n=1 Tax=Cardamine amara subsp. amara TaxID=228776 RepID=A0ABD0ZQJ8_CARAN
MYKQTTTLLLFLSTLLLLTTSLAKDLCNQDDKNALIKIKKSLNNPYHLASWDPQSDCCSWYCIECGDATVNHRVIALTIFSAADISGQIPPEVGDLQYLQKLIFRKLPNLTGQIQPTIAKLKIFTFLRLAWTNLTGPVPEFLSQLKNFQYIDLSFNNLTGSIPSSLSSLQKLEYINLSSIPESFGSLSGQVPYLLLSHNQLSGSIPKSLGNLDFNEIDLSRNKLQGDASMLFGANKTTWSIDLSRNMFNFDLSKVVLAKTINGLDLNHNGITGTIPVHWRESSEV